MSKTLFLFCALTAVVATLITMFTSSDSEGKGKCPMGFSGGQQKSQGSDCPSSGCSGGPKKSSKSSGGMPNVARSDDDDIGAADLSDFYSNPAVFSKEEVKAHNGAPGTADPTSLWLVVLGEVFDVSSAPDYYGHGSDYNSFVGQDNSAAFHTGEFTSVQPDVLSLDVTAIPSIIGWRKFYRRHESYKFVGVMHGIYHKRNGSQRLALREIDKMMTNSRGIDRREKAKRETFPRCALRYDGESKMTTITCDGHTSPRLLTWKHESTGMDVQQCVCLGEAEATPETVTARLGVVTTVGSYGAQCDRSASCQYRPF